MECIQSENSLLREIALAISHQYLTDILACRMSTEDAARQAGRTADAAMMWALKCELKGMLK